MLEQGIKSMPYCRMARFLTQFKRKYTVLNHIGFGSPHLMRKSPPARNIFVILRRQAKNLPHCHSEPSGEESRLVYFYFVLLEILRFAQDDKSRFVGEYTERLYRSVKSYQIMRAPTTVGNDLSVVPQNTIKIHGRAWIFSENGHPFVRIRGHFPCQGNHPPLQRGAESTPPTHEIYCVHVGNGRTVPQTSPFIGEVARRSRDGGAKHIKIHGRAWKPATTRKYIACVGANCVRPRRGQAPALPCKMYFVRRGKTQQTPRTRKGQTNPRPITGRGF